MIVEQKNPLLDQLKRELEFRNYSARTVNTYCSLMKAMSGRIRVPLECLKLTDFKTYLHGIVSEGLSASTVNQYISAFKILKTDVLGGEWEDFKIRRPRKNKRLPVVLSLQEVERLINANHNLKHKAIVMLAYSSGLRRNEVLHLLPAHIDSERMQVRVLQGKGKKDRYTILSSKTLEVLRLYYKYERPRKYLFEPHNRKGHPLSETTLAKIVKNKLKLAKISKEVSFHTLRHTFATHLLEKGVNLRLIQQFMGHSSLKTTTVYLHLTKVDPSGVSSPLDEMNI